MTLGAALHLARRCLRRNASLQIGDNVLSLSFWAKLRSTSSRIRSWPTNLIT
jgi:hypothetical protein